MEALFYHENVIIFLFILALPFADFSQTPDVFGGINVIVSLVLSRILRIKEDEINSVNLYFLVSFSVLYKKIE